MTNEFKSWMSDPFPEVVFRASEVVVNNNHLGGIRDMKIKAHAETHTCIKNFNAKLA